MSNLLLDSNQKLRGGYYTPFDIASAIVDWALNQSGLTVLEPSFGDGEFLKAVIYKKFALGESINDIDTSLFGVELDEIECRKFIEYAQNTYGFRFANLFCEDFFIWFEKFKEEFDVVIGNPPFIRYQNFPEPSRTKALTHSEINGVKLNKLTNIWVPFVVLSVALLKEHGRIGMVIPAELLQVSYAGALRKYFIDSFRNIAVFTCNELFFENAEQEVVIVLADGKHNGDDKEENIEVIETPTKDALVAAIRQYKSARQSKDVLHSHEKWTKYFLNQEEIRFIREIKKDERISFFGDYFEVDVGVVTGRNDFFILNKEITAQFDLQDFVIPAVGRSYQIKNEFFEFDDWLKLWKAGDSVGLLDLTKVNGLIPTNVRNYLDYGEENNVHKGYKCSIRKEWYKVPSIWIPDAFLFRQIHDFPHLVVNKARAVPTDTIHRVRKKDNHKFHQVLFYTYLTASSAEIEGRSYGGGVLEIEPSEAERLLIPNPALIDFDRINYEISRRENGKFLKRNSQFILGEILQFTQEEIDLLESIYKKLFSRRDTRKKR